MKILNIYNRTNHYVLSFDYNASAIENLKKNLRHKIDRDYDPELIRWTVNKRCIDFLKEWASTFFDKSILHVKENSCDIEYDFITGRKEAEQVNLF